MMEHPANCPCPRCVGLRINAKLARWGFLPVSVECEPIDRMAEIRQHDKQALQSNEEASQ